ncbi:MAG: ribonuclease H-like domain-containing protein [Hyalangium sp.]|uniref:ribonuclease H-like domain-containing protein n=1 Tax=Hyalangium sp. TaxID=2028555 RepID=UPI00389A3B30
MLQRTFQHIPGVGPFREKDLWAQGIKTWDDFPAAGTGAPAISRKADDVAREYIAKAREALARRDLRALAQLVPSREHWRMYPEFAQDALFFDIETDGNENQVPTVVSLYDSAGLHVFLQGRNMDELPEAMAARRLWVSFNGTCFDAPVLRDYFGANRFPKPDAHIDLRFVTKRLRMSGGLKEIEDNLGVGRPPHLKGVNGWDAVLLWRAYKARADVEALRFLVEYNLYDSFQLRTLMDVAYNRGADELNQDVPRLPVFDRGEVLYDVSKIILDLGPTERDMETLARVRSQDRDLREL